MKRFFQEQVHIKTVHLEFFSPAPMGTLFFFIDTAPVRFLNRFHRTITASGRAIPAPDHLHMIDKLPPELKRHSLPLVPNTDFFPALQGKGPEWHKYQREFKDLKFVATIGLSAFAMATYDPEIRTPQHLIGKRIGIRPRPSSLRVLKQAILKDAWGIYDKVILKDCFRPQAKDGLLKGDFDATFWFENRQVVDGFECCEPLALEAKDAGWVGLSFEDIDRINRNNPWKLHRVLVPRGSLRANGPKLDPTMDIGMAGLSTALCAWDSTEDEVVYELLRFMDEHSHLWPDFTKGCPLSLSRMSSFPGLTEDVVHSGALKYYNEMGIKIEEPVQLHEMNDQVGV
ncbi:ABC transporter substrate-binding protein [Thermodesulfobacteriota bacterium]